MIKKTLITLPVILWCLFANAQTPWVKVRIDEQIAVKFPSAPVKKSESTYVYTNKDSTIVLILEIHTSGDNDPEDPIIGEFFKKEDKSNDSIPPVVEDVKTGTWNGYVTMSSSLVMGARRLSNYNIIIGSKGYMLAALLTGNTNLKVKDEYFSSISLNK